MATGFRACQQHIKADGENGGHHKHLEHKIIERTQKQGAEGFGDEGVTLVVAKLFSALFEVVSGEAGLHIDLKFFSEARKT